MKMGELGKAYDQGAEIFHEGDSGDKMYVVQTGKVQIVKRSPEGELVLATLGPGDIFGEMALFGNNVRSATVRILEEARILSIDKKIFVQKIHDDPSLAFRVIQKMSDRIRNLNEEVARLTHPE